MLEDVCMWVFVNIPSSLQLRQWTKMIVLERPALDRTMMIMKGTRRPVGSLGTWQFSRKQSLPVPWYPMTRLIHDFCLSLWSLKCSKILGYISPQHSILVGIKFVTVNMVKKNGPYFHRIWHTRSHRHRSRTKITMIPVSGMADLKTWFGDIKMPLGIRKTRLWCWETSQKILS